MVVMRGLPAGFGGLVALMVRTMDRTLGARRSRSRSWVWAGQCRVKLRSVSARSVQSAGLG